MAFPLPAAGRHRAPDVRYAPPQHPEPVAYRPDPPASLREEHGRPVGRARNAPPPPGRPPRKRRSLKQWLVIAGVVLLVLLMLPIGMMLYYDVKLRRVDALPNYAGRPADTPGTNWLVVGADGRAGVDGSRTDTMMLVHIPSSGPTVIVSLPRDLYVPVPGNGSHKLNFSFGEGGPQLLARTVETQTDIHIDHYAEIGFGGFREIVDAVGGVEMCLDKPLKDPLADLDVKAGCQTLDGRQALGFVRTRYLFASADLQRVKNQRQFLSALMDKATSPSTLLNPFRLFPLASSGVDALTVDDGTHMWDLARLAWNFSGAVTTTAPDGGAIDTPDGVAQKWSADTDRFFAALRDGKQIPADLLRTDGR